ncbi:MAG: transporter [Herpetosiphonaceae bacterium]|nr:MAG: transporter [Herpetosiphonaceae bacterium]
MLDNRYNDRYIVDTPEHIEFGYDIAGIGSRFLAAVLDSIIIGLIITFISIVAVNIFEVSRFGVWIILSALWLFVITYYILFERLWTGQTPGKRALGIRVVQEQGHPVSQAGSVIRNFIRLVDFLPFFYGIGVITMFVDRRIRRLGDLAAGTLVVQDRAPVTLESLLQSQTPVFKQAQGPGQPLLPNLQALTPADISVVHDFLQQRLSLYPQRRQYLAHQLAYVLFTRLGYSVPGHPEQFLEQVAAQYAQINQ